MSKITDVGAVYDPQFERVKMRDKLRAAALAEPTVKESLTPQRPWVGLTDEEKYDCYLKIDVWSRCVESVESKLKEKNT